MDWLAVRLSPSLSFSHLLRPRGIPMVPNGYCTDGDIEGQYYNVNVWAL